MSGLYNRNYFVLTEEEIKERERLDAESCIPGFNFRRSCYHDYPKAVRHNMSLFPNNFIDIVDLSNNCLLQKECDEFKTMIENRGNTELSIKRFIQNNGYYHIPASLLKYYHFGHHSAYVFKEFKLGTSYVADYLLIGDSSDGHQFVFVECENPYGNVTMQGGEFGEVIRKGINQVNDWRIFIEGNYSALTAEYKKAANKPLPDEFYTYNSARFNYMVIAGRRADFNDRTRNSRMHQRKANNTVIYHYDNWYDIAVSKIGDNTY